MGTKVKTLVGSLAGCVLFVSTAAAQTQSPPGRSALDDTLYRSLVERVQMPLAFATRDTAFALSLPADEPAEVYVQLTVGKNGKVKKKLTRVNANHIAGYVTPAFTEAAKGMRVDRSLLNGNDTSLLLAFSIEYQCVLDTINKAWPSMEPGNILITEENAYNVAASAQWKEQWYQSQQSMPSVQSAEREYKYAKPTRVWYYLAFLKDQPE